MTRNNRTAASLWSIAVWNEQSRTAVTNIESIKVSVVDRSAFKKPNQLCFSAVYNISHTTHSHSRCEMLPVKHNNIIIMWICEQFIADITRQILPESDSFTEDTTQTFDLPVIGTW